MTPQELTVFNSGVDAQITNQTTQGSITPTIIGTKIKTLASSLNDSKVEKETGKRLITSAEGDKIHSIIGLRMLPTFTGPSPLSKFNALDKGFSDGSRMQETSRYKISPLIDGVGYRFVYANWVMGNTGVSAGEQTGPNPITVKFGCYNNGSIPGLFNGKPSVTIEPGGVAVSDPLFSIFKPGDNINLSTVVSVSTSGQKWPLGLYTQPTLNEGVIEGDKINDNVGQSFSKAFGPIGVVFTPLAVSEKMTLFVMSDSIGNGNANGSNDNIDQDQGFIHRGLVSIGVPHVRFAVGGDTMENHIGNQQGFALALAYATGCDAFLTTYGANDIPSFATLADAKAAYIKWWTYLSSSGSKVYQTTILPRTSFNTAQEAIRVGMNDFIRTTPAPLYGYVEAADPAETARNSGVQKPNIFFDGVHPGAPAGEIALAAGVFNQNMFNRI